MDESNEETLRILLVDDDADERELFSSTLKSLNLPHKLNAADSCKSLFETLEKDALPHVIFMDINMPSPNGHECVKKIKSHKIFSHIPIIMYSVSASETDIEEAYGAGAHHYVVKPHVHINLPHTLKKAFHVDWRKPPTTPKREEFVIHIAFNE
jgi:CheY-like chemotaxis protein